MDNKAKDLYLDLLKKTLSFSLWPEPPIPVKDFHRKKKTPKRFLLSIVSGILNKTKYQLVRRRDFATQDRADGKVWPGYADTMIGLRRLDNLQRCIETVIADGIEGDLVETGVWRGGACIFMRAVLAAHGVKDRKVFVADSFEGLPRPDADRWPADRGDTQHTRSYLAVSREEVEKNFKRYSLLDDNVIFLEGWFKDTLPAAPIGKLSIMRLDGDMYGSTMDALTNLYPKLSSGGFCIIDDYALESCQKAVDDFRQQHGIAAKMEAIDWTGQYWRKE